MSRGAAQERILLVTGASGGHIYPALGLLDALREKYPGCGTLLVLPKVNPVTPAELSGQNIRFIPAMRLGAGFRIPVSIFGICAGALESIWILLVFRPGLVIGFGSLNSLPAVCLARALGIKTMIHEQNVVPGRANVFLFRFCDKAAVSFLKTRDYLPGHPEKIVFTGNPLRKSLTRMDRQEALSFFGLAEGKFTLLVSGGSQGSQRINAVFLEAMAGLGSRDKLQVIHLCGRREYAALETGYRGLGVDVRLFGFLKDMQYAYSAADMILCRAGATTLAEVIHFAIPAVLIPYPYAHKHQVRNAEVLSSIGAALAIDDSRLEAAALRDTLTQLMADAGKLERMRSAYRNLSKGHAAEVFMQEALFLLRQDG